MSVFEKDKSFGVVPLYKKKDESILFCLVKHSAGHWSFPKGHQEVGESEEEASLRELKEETGVDEVVLVPERTYQEKYSFTEKGVTYDKEVKYLVGWVRSTESTTLNDFKAEILDLRWVTYEEANKLITFPAAREVLEDVNKDIKNSDR